MAMDGTIQRFEFTYELFWTVLKKRLLQNEQVAIQCPKQAFQAAYKLGWLGDA
jgi:nucleotidyltransferase substrate binding protein (TIGR01987 family)